MELKMQQLRAALEKLSQKAQVFVPSVSNERTMFVPFTPEVTPDFDTINVMLPPKDLLFPQTEDLYSYKMENGQLHYEANLSHTKRVMFGVRPCDARSLVCMDEVFLTKGFVDANYQARRAELTVVALGCTKAEETCFCESMGVSPWEAPGADVMMIPTESGFNMKAQSDKGTQLLEEISEMLSPEDGQALPGAKCTLRPSMEGVAKALGTLFEHPMWDKIYRPCLTCGTCTFLCPTCYCFDVNSEAGKNCGEAYRCWDSCMFTDYTKMAGGHNPRPSKKNRVRNRYMHKLSWFEERYGHTLCVGCGRCIRHCPVGMDITKVMEQAKEAAAV